MDDTRDAAPSSTEPEAVSMSIESKASLEQAPIATAAVEDPNATTDVAAQPDIQPSAPAASTPSGILGTVESLPAEVAGYIRTHLAEIKQHLSIKGFEQSAVKFIHYKIAAIEKWL